MRRGIKIIVAGASGLVILLIGVGIGSAGNSSGNSASAAQPTVTVSVPAGANPDSSTYSPAPEVTVTVKPKAPQHTTMSGSGVFVVGLDIKHGTYHTSGAVGGSGGNCYYALLSSTNTNDIIDNENVTGPATITVGSGVKAVETNGCKTWHRI